MRVGIAFDLRNPAPWRRPWLDHYAVSLELIQEAERLGIDSVKVSEHHGFEDGYMPQPLTFLAAVAAVTARIGLATGVLNASLHRSVEIAEQAAVVDGISGSRLELALGAGYDRAEFELYGVAPEKRYRLLEHRVRKVRELWASSRTTPVPERGDLPIWLGVAGPHGSGIAGRLGAGLLTLDAANWSVYLNALADAGHAESIARAGGTLQIVLSEDPEREFASLIPRIAHDARTYERARRDSVGASGGARRPMADRDASSSRDRKTWAGYGVLTPQEACDRVVELAAGRRLADIDIVYISVAPAGVVDDLAHRNVELVATRLAPLLRAAVQADAVGRG